MTSHRVLTGLAHNIADSFPAPTMLGAYDVMDEMTRLAREHDVPSFSVDLWTGTVRPDAPTTDKIRNGVQEYCRDFPDLLRRNGLDPALVSVASIDVSFEPTESRRELPYEIKVRLVDTAGREHLGKRLGRW